VGYQKNLSDPTLEPNRLKNVTKFVPQKQSEPTLEPNRLANCHKWDVTKTHPNSVGLENCHKWGVTKTYPNSVGLENCHKWVVTKTYPNSVGLENCHKWGVTKNLSEIFRTWKLSQQQAAVPRDEADPLHSGKNLSDPTLEPNRLKNVTKFVPQKQSDPTFEPNGLKNCHKWGVTKNLSKLCRT